MSNARRRRRQAAIRRAVRVEGHLVGDVIEGEWCEHCALPSVCRVRCVVAPVHDPTQIWWAGWVETCRDCGRQAHIKDYGTVDPHPFD